MNSETNNNKQRRGIYLLPNLLTTACLFSGFYAIVAATQAKFEVAAVAIFVAMIMDGLDGRVARMANATSEFGAQYDSLADMVSFGVAPALIMYEWALSGMRDFGMGKLGWCAAFIYIAAAALRLARFNTQLQVADKRIFRGLASPASAAIMVGLVWVGDDLGYKGNELIIAAFITTVLCGLLMVSNFAYYSFKDLTAKNRVPFAAMLLIVLVFVFIAFDPPKVLFAFFLVYMLSGPFTELMRRVRKRSILNEKLSEDSD